MVLSKTYFGDILWISWGYQEDIGDIFGINWEYLRDIFFDILGYIGDTSGLSFEIWGMSLGYLGYMWGIPGRYLGDVLLISC